MIDNILFQTMTKHKKIDFRFLKIRLNYLQVKVSHQTLVHLPRAPAPLMDRPDYQRLPPVERNPTHTSLPLKTP